MGMFKSVPVHADLCDAIHIFFDNIKNMNIWFGYREILMTTREI